MMTDDEVWELREARMRKAMHQRARFGTQDANVRVITYDATANAEAVARARKVSSGAVEVTCTDCGQTRTIARVNGYSTGRCPKCARRAWGKPAVRPCTVCGHLTRSSRNTEADHPGTRPRYHGDVCTTCKPRHGGAA